MMIVVRVCLGHKSAIKQNKKTCQHQAGWRLNWCAIARQRVDFNENFIFK